MIHFCSLLVIYLNRHYFSPVNLKCTFTGSVTPEMGKTICKDTRRHREISLSPPTKTDHAGAAITFDCGGEHKNIKLYTHTEVTNLMLNSMLQSHLSSIIHRHHMFLVDEFSKVIVKLTKSAETHCIVCSTPS